MVDRDRIGVWLSKPALSLLGAGKSDPEIVGFFSRNPKDAWDAAHPMNPQLDTLGLIKLSVETLGNIAAQVFAPHQSLAGRADLVRGVFHGWGDTAGNMRRAVLELAGKYGPSRPTRERRVLLDRGRLQVGDLSVWFEGEDFEHGVWRYSHREFPFSLQCEVAACVLRDLLTRKYLKKYYFPFLLARAASSWSGLKLARGAETFSVVQGWMPPKAIDIGTPEDVEDGTGSTPGDGDGAQSEIDVPDRLHTVYVRPKRGEEFGVALCAGPGDRFALCRITHEDIVPGSDDESGRVIYRGNPLELVWFATWEQLVAALSDMAVNSVVATFAIPAFPDPITNHAFPFWLSEVGGVLTRIQKTLRAGLEKTFGSVSGYAGVAKLLQCGERICNPLVADKTLVFESGRGFALLTMDGKNPSWSVEELARMICIVLADPLTGEVCKTQWAPFLMVVLEKWIGRPFQPAFGPLRNGESAAQSVQAADTGSVATAEQIAEAEKVVAAGDPVRIESPVSAALETAPSVIPAVSEVDELISAGMAACERGLRSIIVRHGFAA